LEAAWYRSPVAPKAGHLGRWRAVHKAALKVGAALALECRPLGRGDACRPDGRARLGSRGRGRTCPGDRGAPHRPGPGQPARRLGVPVAAAGRVCTRRTSGRPPRS